MPSLTAIYHIKEKYRLKRLKVENTDIESCEDYGHPEHKSKDSYKCSLYVSKKRKIGSKDDVGTKIEKEKGEKQRLEVASNNKSNNQVQICKSCGQTGHRSARSKECSYKATLDEAMKNELGGNYERFARKVYLDAVIRNVLFRAQLFVNAYIVNNKDSTDSVVITQQNFWYAISQLIMGQKDHKQGQHFQQCRSWFRGF
ncbi:unnamed protein product [Rhizopus microsporus]